MPLSQFTKAKFDATGTISVSGPFDLNPAEHGMKVTCLHFLLIQGEEFAQGDGEADDTGKWDGVTNGPANNIRAGQPAQGVGFAVLARSGSDVGYETYSWSHTVTVEAA